MSCDHRIYTGSKPRLENWSLPGINGNRHGDTKWKKDNSDYFWVKYIRCTCIASSSIKVRLSKVSLCEIYLEMLHTQNITLNLRNIDNKIEYSLLWLFVADIAGKGRRSLRVPGPGLALGISWAGPAAISDSLVPVIQVCIEKCRVLAKVLNRLSTKPIIK